MPVPERDPDQQHPQAATSRRSLLRSLGGAGVLVALAGAGAAPAIAKAAHALTHDDHSDDASHGGHGGDDDGTVAVNGTIPAGSTEVRIVSDDPDGFSPSTVTIDAGQSVTFVNAYHDPHTATGGSFDTGILQPGAMATIIFKEAGTFAYACSIHPEMLGSVIVRGTPSASTPSATPQAATPAASTPVATKAAVTIQDFSFDPPELRIAVGTTVTWTNKDQTAHTATADDGSFDTGTIDPGKTGTAHFTKAGRVAYHCAIHPNMTAVIVVE